MDLSQELLAQLDSLRASLTGLSAADGLRRLTEVFDGHKAFSTSLGIEDQLITHHIFEQNLPIRVFTLDTGRLFNETYTLLHKTNNHYGKRIQVYFPKHKAVEQLVNDKGPMSFYNSIDDRKQCCFIRKVEPLNRALQGVQIWVTGIRAEQSGARQDLQLLEWDEAHQLIKYNPLLDYTLEQVKDEIKALRIPYNPLHDKGFVSIGCAPCTRAIAEGEDFRAGRWWWEDNSKKECGLHAR